MFAFWVIFWGDGRGKGFVGRWKVRIAAQYFGSGVLGGKSLGPIECSLFKIIFEVKIR